MAFAIIPTQGLNLVVRQKIDDVLAIFRGVLDNFALGVFALWQAQGSNEQGTIADFLNALKGDPGTPGDPGPAGPTTIVPCVPDGNANAITLAPQTGYALTSEDQLLTWQAIGTNNGNVTVNVAGAGALPVVMPDTGKDVPSGAIRVGHVAVIRLNTAGTRYDLIAPSFAAQPTHVQLVQINTSGDALQARIAQPGVKLPAAFNNVEFVLEVAGDRGAAGASIRLFEYDGVTPVAGIGAMPLRLGNGTDIIPAGFWLTGDTIRFRRSGTTGLARLMQASSAPLRDL
ncbi:MAG: hypothetical protein ABJL67_16870, partial [Sulfitobacter sp.]